MERKDLISKYIELELEHKENLNNIEEIIDKENPMYSVMIRRMSNDIIYNVRELLFDALDFPTELREEEYATKVNYERSVIGALLDCAIKDPEKYTEPVKDIAADWENLKKYTNPASTLSWFYHQKVLDMYINRPAEKNDEPKEDKKKSKTKKDDKE